MMFCNYRLLLQMMTSTNSSELMPLLYILTGAKIQEHRLLLTLWRRLIKLWENLRKEKFIWESWDKLVRRHSSRDRRRTKPEPKKVNFLYQTPLSMNNTTKIVKFCSGKLSQRKNISLKCSSPITEGSSMKWRPRKWLNSSKFWPRRSGREAGRKELQIGGILAQTRILSGRGGAMEASDPLPPRQRTDLTTPK